MKQLAAERAREREREERREESQREKQRNRETEKAREEVLVPMRGACVGRGCWFLYDAHDQ